MRTPRPYPRDAINVLFGAYRRRVLGMLLLRPDESFHVREIARQAEVPAGSLHRELRLLSRAGLLLREQLGNQVRYRADASHPLYEELAGLFRKSTGLADVLRAALALLERAIEVAFVFGSLAKEQARSVSDVDVFVVGSCSFERVVTALSACQAKLGREVNPVVWTRSKLRAAIRKREPFWERVAREPRIFLIGGEDDLREPAQDRAA